MRYVLLLCLVGCSTPPVSTSSQSIIGGTRSTGITSAVLLVSYPQDRSTYYACSAVVISPTVVLTAAHCVDTPNHPGFVFGVFTGDDGTPYSASAAAFEPQLLPVAAVHAHPDYQTNSPFLADIGVAILASPLTITPSPLRRDPIDQTIVGAPAQIVGYGQKVYNQFNLARYEAMTTVASVESDTIVVGDAQKHGCLGDSGGPAFVDGILVGVDSYGPSGCTAASHYRRTDAFVPFIDTYAPPPIDADGFADRAEAGVDPAPSSDGGGCSTSGGAGLAMALGLVGLGRRRRSS